MERSVLRSYLFSVALVAVLFLSGCVGQTEQPQSVKDVATSGCKALCEAALSRGEDLSNGPCLSNGLQNAEGWVCDVAHSPRQAVDNDPTNQCSAYRTGTAMHFVEVDTSCNLIRAV